MAAMINIIVQLLADVVRLMVLQFQADAIGAGGEEPFPSPAVGAIQGTPALSRGGDTASGARCDDKYLVRRRAVSHMKGCYIGIKALQWARCQIYDPVSAVGY